MSIPDPLFTSKRVRESVPSLPQQRSGSSLDKLYSALDEFHDSKYPTRDQLESLQQAIDACRESRPLGNWPASATFRSLAQTISVHRSEYDAVADTYLLEEHMQAIGACAKRLGLLVSITETGYSTLVHLSKPPETRPKPKPHSKEPERRYRHQPRGIGGSLGGYQPGRPTPGGYLYR